MSDEENSVSTAPRSMEINTQNALTENMNRELRTSRSRSRRTASIKSKRANKGILHYLLTHYYNTNYFASITLAFLLLLLSLLTWPYKIENIKINKDEDNKITVRCGFIVLIILSLIIAYITLSIFIRWITRYIQHKKRVFSYPFYIIYHLSSNLSFAIVIGLLYAYTIYTNKTFEISREGQMKTNTNDLIIIFTIGNAVLLVISAFVCNIAFNFNRVTLIDRMLVTFKVDYFIKLLKYIKGNMNKPGKAAHNEFWEFGFPWMPANGDHLHYRRPEYDSKKELFFTTNTLGLTPAVRDWIYIEFRKQPIDIIYTNYSEQLLDMDTKKLPKTVRKIADPEKFGIHRAENLEKFFQDTKKFEAFCRVMNFNRDTVFSSVYMAEILKRNLAEKRYIQLSLDQINGALTRIKNTVFSILIVLIIVYTTIVVYENKQMILAVVSAFFGTGYAFQSTVKNSIDNIIFLLCIHPYDVGDRVLIYLDLETQNLVVQEMNVFSTVFSKFDGSQTYVPNIALATKQIVNISRSGYMIETHRIKVNTKICDGTIKKIDSDIQEQLAKCPDDFTGFYMLNVDTIDNANQMRLVVIVQYKRNWHDYSGYLQLKGGFLRFLRRIFEKYEIDFVLPHQPVKIIRN